MSARALTFVALEGLPEIHPGDDLVSLMLDAAQRDAGFGVLNDGDVIVLAQKIVSKSEDRFVALASVEPSAEAQVLATTCRKDPRLVELVLRESSEIVRVAPNVLIARHRLGFVVANAAIDQSNVPGGEARALLLPLDPDASARRVVDAVYERIGVRVAVLIADSFGRPWRQGVCGVCVGCAGLESLVDLRGQADREGRSLQVTQLAIADQLCAGASIVLGEASEGTPLVRVRGVPASYLRTSRGARELVRPIGEDLFR
ncbi:MAG: F420-0--gamma-glutamyl ligase [Panacagrimonas sp.]|jgi:coenzyme F420-0:L-glutamate ligase/coenzyme F420-1:gamma-L-glutamate ligase|nr:coenzyme F420-0:L-glutamate ligase [Panacagrimonas sp.]MCC2655290.1 F420-0--gamma-glutamyl ligase [Panacagrimonas sp.]